MIEKINQVIDKHIEMYKSVNSSYELIKVTNDNWRVLLENEAAVARFLDNRIKENFGMYDFCMIYFIDKSTNEITFSTCFIFFKPEQYDKIKFWHLNEHIRQLEKQSINSLFYQNHPDLIMTIGFTRNLKITIGINRFFLKLAKELLSLNIFTFVETTGLLVLSDSFTSKSHLNLSQVNQVILNSIGKTNNASAPVENFCKKMGMVEQPLLFNIRTLGKVYIKI